jgi:transcriptional antiterminator
MMHLPECQVANWIGSKLGRFLNMNIPECEVYSIALQLLSAKIWETGNDNKYEEDNFKTRQIVIRIVLNMEKLLETEFMDNAVLIDGLCNHMRPALNRMRMNVFSENGHLDMLKEKYLEIYQATIAACGFLKKELNIEEIAEEEIGFIAMYFCVAMEKKQSDDSKILTYIVCRNGIGTSSMLSVRLQKEFPQIRVQRILPSQNLTWN